MSRDAVVRGAVLAVLVSVTLAACASGGGTAGGESRGEGASATPTPSASSSGTPTDGPPVPVDDLELVAGAVGSGVPAGAGQGDDTGVPGVGWTAADGLLYVVTFGSSTCPLVAEPDATAADGTVTVAFAPLPDRPCTMDFVPTTTVVAVPAGVDESVELPVDLGEGGAVVVPPRPSPGVAGPIAWAAPAA